MTSGKDGRGDFHWSLRFVGLVVMVLLGPLHIRGLMDPIGNVDRKVLPFFLVGSAIWGVAIWAILYEIGVVPF